MAKEGLVRIAFAGLMGSGKTEAARYISERYGVENVPFSRPVKEVGAIKDSALTESQLYFECCDKAQHILPPDALFYEIRALGALWARDIEEAEGKRELWQRIGTDSGRHIRKSLWVDYFERNMEHDKEVVQEGLRFRNELAALDRLGFTVVRVTCDSGVLRERLLARDGSVKPGWSKHASEHGLADVPMREFDNSGDLEELHAFCDELVKERLGGARALGKRAMVRVRAGLAR